MQAVVLAIHLITCVALVVLVLLQRSEGGALGIGGGGGGGLMTGRGAATVLTRATTVLAAVFFTTSLTLAAMAASKGDGMTDAERAAQAAQPVTPEPVLPDLGTLAPSPSAPPVATEDAVATPPVEGTTTEPQASEPVPAPQSPTAPQN